MDPNAPPNPLEVIAAALRQPPDSAEDTALVVFNALLASPVETRQMLASAMLNSLATDDTVIIVTKAPPAFHMDEDANIRPWWPMLPHPAVLNTIDGAPPPTRAKPPAAAPAPPSKPNLRVV